MNMTTMILLGGLGLALVGAGLFVTGSTKPSSKNSLLLRIRGTKSKNDTPKEKRPASVFFVFVPVLVLFSIPFLAGLPIIYSIVGGVAGGFSAIVFLKTKRNARKDKLEDQLPVALDIMSQSVAAGNTMNAAISDMVAGTRPPLSDVLREVSDKAHSTGSLEGAMERAADKENLSVLRMLAVAVRVQKKSGGSFGNILSAVTNTARNAVRLKKMVKVKTASVKTTAISMCVMPLAVSSGLLYFNETYRQATLHTHTGRMILLFAMISMVIGMCIVFKMIRVKR